MDSSIVRLKMALDKVIAQSSGETNKKLVTLQEKLFDDANVINYQINPYILKEIEQEITTLFSNNQSLAKVFNRELVSIEKLQNHHDVDVALNQTDKTNVLDKSKYKGIIKQLQSKNKTLSMATKRRIKTLQLFCDSQYLNKGYVESWLDREIVIPYAGKIAVRAS